MSTTQSHFQKPSSLSRCRQCNTIGKEGTRNLVACVDGTSNEFGRDDTNVVKLFSKIDSETRHPEQLAYYSSGIGTDPKSRSILSRMRKGISDTLDMAFALNAKEIILDVYTWLAGAYREGDQIYLFGFSRGAYQVRVLASMIHEIGLIEVPTEKQIARAYNQYKAARSGHQVAKDMAKKFKDTFSWRGTKVHFVGVWDTVSSVGLVKGKNLLSASSCSGQFCHFRHALALDERRVKFMPEYFNEANALIGPASPEDRIGDIKEVWFAGSHSDVGGATKSWEPYCAGNVSLLWMRREATASGLLLQPTDVVWMPADIDHGVSDSMTGLWRIMEYVPITHQVSFSGSGENSRRWHRLQPRRIIPGQKVHASILYANTYKPYATLGVGFDIPIIHTGLETELDARLWETELFDDTAAQELMVYLGDQQGQAPNYLNTPIYFDRLLFMLRSKEGKQCIRNVPNWRTQFLGLVHNQYCAPFVRLVILVAYYEASYDPDADPKSLAQLYVELSQETFDDAKNNLRVILSTHKHRDGPRVVALLRPLTRHPVLRECILTPDVLETLMEVLDTFINLPGGNFGQAMGGLTCLLQCEDTRGVIIEKLGGNCPHSNIRRLSRILEIKDPRLLTAALRMVITLAQIPEARYVVSMVKPRLRELAEKNKQLVGLLSVEILLALYDPNEQGQLNIRNANVRANLGGASVRLSRDDTADEQSREADLEQRFLRRLFGFDVTELTNGQRRLIGELKSAVRKGNAQERTAATLTLLKLSETECIRTFLREIDLLGVFINQLRRKDSALLAAYALATCLKYGDMKESVKNNELLSRNIVGMLRLDYFDDAVGQVEGFQILGDFLQHADLREEINNCNITAVLNSKLAKGKSKETRTSLICLDIIRSFGTYDDGPRATGLVVKSLDHLRQPEWKAQKAGVMILSALAQTEHGVAAIGPRLHEIVEMLLPKGYLLIRPTASEPPAASPTSQGEPGAQPDSPDSSSKPVSEMMGPACALRILVQNEKLRNTTRSTLQYSSLKHLYLAGVLIDETDTSAWRVNTPNRADVIDVLGRIIKFIDGELSEEGLVAVGDTVLPHVKHWDRLGVLLRNRTVAAITILPTLLGVSTLAVLAAVVVTSVYLSVRAAAFLKKVMARYQDAQILDMLLGVSDTHISIPGDSSSRESEHCEGSSNAHDGEGSHSTKTVVSQGGANAETVPDAASP